MENDHSSVSKKALVSKRYRRAGLWLLVMSAAVGAYTTLVPSSEVASLVTKSSIALAPSMAPQGTMETAAAEPAPQAQAVVLEDLVINRNPEKLFNREDVLNDYQSRISQEFAVPESLRERVGFWFDVYSRYGSNHRVVHHVQYPWIVFQVVDVTDIINAKVPKFRWMRNMKADEHVDKESNAIKAAIKEIAAGRYKKGNKHHAMVAKALAPLSGTLQAKAKKALGNVRVQMGQRDFFARGIEVSPRYLPGMEEIFRNHKLPVELTRLPFVESSFNKHATSKVGASGIWQFMDYTGKNFMIVNDHIDERRSPFKATVGAARLLKENHMILKRSWPLAITAWNHGPGGVRKAMKATGTTDLGKIVGRYSSKSFDFASSNFYCEFLAALYAEKYHDEIFPEVIDEKPLDLHAVKLAQKTSTKELFRRSGLAKEDFLLYNPDLKQALEKNHPIPKGFTVMVDTPSQVVLNNLLTKDTRASKPTKITQSGISSNEANERN